MRKISISLPIKLYAEPLFSFTHELRRARRGQKISRLFRRIFEHSNIRRILGSNLAAAAIVSSFFPASHAIFFESDGTVVNAQETPNFNTEAGIQYPLKTIKVNQGYSLFHPGIDLDGETGDPVYPIANGYIENVQYSQYAYGNAIIVAHSGSEFSSLYAHLSKIEVEKGQEVTTSTEIGKMGSTGHSSGSHLHLEIRDGAVPINPFLILR